MKSWLIAVTATCIPALAQISAPAQAQDSPEARAYPIAGLTPSVRPAGAPVITKVEHPKGWESRFYHGIAKPYPPHLGSLENVGAWYTPFDHPGMTGRYDIRGWHQAKSPQKRARGRK